MDIDFEYINWVKKLDVVEQVLNQLKNIKKEVVLLPEVETEFASLVYKLKALKKTCKNSIKELLDEAIVIAEVLEDTDIYSDYFD